MLTVAGPAAAEVLQALQLDPVLLEKPAGSHALLNFGGSPVIVAVGSGLASPGYTLIADEAVAGDLWRVLAAKVLLLSATTIPCFILSTMLASRVCLTPHGVPCLVVSLASAASINDLLAWLLQGAVPMGEVCWERQRILQARPKPCDPTSSQPPRHRPQEPAVAHPTAGAFHWPVVEARLPLVQGRPLPGTELTDAVNPLEAGLYHAVSLSKGCYMGQETLAKVHTKDAVKQQLWGLRLSQPGQLGADVTLGAFVGAPGHPPSASPRWRIRRLNKSRALQVFGARSRCAVHNLSLGDVTLGASGRQAPPPGSHRFLTPRPR